MNSEIKRIIDDLQIDSGDYVTKGELAGVLDQFQDALMAPPVVAFDEDLPEFEPRTATEVRPASKTSGCVDPTGLSPLSPNNPLNPNNPMGGLL